MLESYQSSIRHFIYSFEQDILSITYRTREGISKVRKRELIYA